jgi:hypothetical protein
LEIDKHYSPNIKVANKSVIKWGEFINQFDYFDAAFYVFLPISTFLGEPELVHLDLVGVMQM